MTTRALPFEGRGRVGLFGAPPGHDARLIADFVGPAATLLVVARDDVRLAALADGLAFFAPDLECLPFPAWDCLPYDRVSPNPEIVSRRIDALCRLAAEPTDRDRPRAVLTTIAAALQRVPPRALMRTCARTLRQGETAAPDDLVHVLGQRGYIRVETVTEAGEFAVRGGIIDVFPPGVPEPLRLDFFGDEIETIRTFESATQRSTGTTAAVAIKPVSEVFLDDGSIGRFRSGYRGLFGASVGDDPLYQAVSARRRLAGMEHWLPLFHERLETLFDYVDDCPVILDDQLDSARENRIEMIADYYQARRDFDGSRFAIPSESYRPVPAASLYLDGEAWSACLEGRLVGQLSPFPPTEGQGAVVDGGGRPGLDFAEARSRPGVNVFDEVAQRIGLHQGAGRRVLIATVTRGSRERLAAVLAEHRIPGVTATEDWAAIVALPPHAVAVTVWPLEKGFVSDDLAVITEEDILGDRLIRRARKRSRAENFLTEASALNAGDLVVHIEHGIGRYEGLETITAGGAPHDCLRIVYAGGDKLYLPVENIEVVSRYGSETEGVVLDKLGGAAWQARKARLKARIREMADELIKVAAARALRSAPALTLPEGLFDEFCARFPYTETDDQARAIADVLSDLGAGRPADRLICGDVGFGKTEVALRAAFVTAMQGSQVAVVVPTTLLCRQHYRTFAERFAGFPIRIGELSRLVTSKQTKAVKADLAAGTLDVIVGTHALLAKDIRFRDLALLIVDEEQHFGVAHKEQLKRLRADVHVITLTATPIPRTLQMALTGVRELSLIATPPVDRLAVRTFVLEFDPVVIREAILREHYRGGQTFYVCPRIEDLSDVAEMLKQLVPEVRITQAHGRMAARDLEAAIGAFYDRAYDVLLSTNIIESGLDLPAVNTIVIHRADMFGLAQLYQLRGRVGRSKIRAYAYLTLPPRKKLTPAAGKRLSVMQALDALGAGFTLASHDLDIRGAGNLLGDEQSGHIREVGIELYQQMLEDAVAQLRGSGGEGAGEEAWSPQLTLGLSVLIPEAYVPDLNVRLGLYRRLGGIATAGEIESFAAELIDRFGPLPEEVRNLLDVVAVKQLCRRAGIERIEAGPKGAVVSFRDNRFADPEALVGYIARQAIPCKLRPDQKMVFRQDWEVPAERLAGVRWVLADLVRLAEPKPAKPRRSQ